MANKKLKRGEILFTEGEPSKSMYFIQRDSLRLYKKKGNSPIELRMVHSGEVIGEMGFLDGGPRSAAAEAMSDTDLVEITGDKMQDQLKVMPPWLIVLLKTVVNRLRSANVKIKQLDTASTAISYGRDGPTNTYAFLSPYDIMKVSAALLLAGHRSAEKNAEGLTKIKMSTVQKFANNIMGEHLSKIMEMIDLLSRADILKIDRIPDTKGGEKVDVYVKDLDLLDAFLTFVNEENLKDQTKKLSFSNRGVLVMALIAKYISEYPADTDGISTINMASIIAKEKALNGGKDPFLPDEFNELVRNKIASELAISDSNTVLTKINAVLFMRLLKMQRILKEIDIVNEGKRRAA